MHPAGGADTDLIRGLAGGTGGAVTRLLSAAEMTGDPSLQRLVRDAVAELRAAAPGLDSVGLAYLAGREDERAAAAGNVPLRAVPGGRRAAGPRGREGRPGQSRARGLRPVRE